MRPKDSETDLKSVLHSFAETFIKFLFQLKMKVLIWKHEKNINFFSENACRTEIYTYLCNALDEKLTQFEDIKSAVAESIAKCFFTIGLVVQLVRIRACHARGRGFESRPDRRY